MPKIEENRVRGAFETQSRFQSDLGIDFATLSLIFPSRRQTRAKTVRFMKNLKRHHRVAQKSRFGVCAHASKVDGKSLRTRFSTESHERSHSKSGLFEFLILKAVPEASTGCLWRRHGTTLGSLWALLGRSWAACVRSWSLNFSITYERPFVVEST